MAEMIVETNLLYTPSLAAVDGTKCRIAGGPCTGELREPGVIIAGDDRIAVDAPVIRAMASDHLWDFPVWSHRRIRRAAVLGLGAAGPGEMEIRCEDAAGSAGFGALMDRVREFTEEEAPA